MIVVTGAAGTVGQAVVRVLARDWPVVAVDFSSHIAEAGQAMSITGIDLSDANATSQLMMRFDVEADGLKGLVNVAGGFSWQTVGEGSWDGWNAMYRTNVQTAYQCCKAALPLLRRGRGAIVNVGAYATTRAGAGMGAYTASKSAVARLTESLAAEELAHSVRVNAILPTVVDTPQNRVDMPEADISRWVTPEELADVVRFLVSERARGITGASIPVAGRVL
jgi:NAD(P)-dependent dehydrogenase (short-subunit alcohol dehydrogenase family)